jgi:prolyl 4-hydroxylase
MAIRISRQVAAWLHAQVVAGVGFQEIYPVMRGHGFSEVEVRKIHAAALNDPDGFKAGFSALSAARPEVAQPLGTQSVQAPLPARPSASTFAPVARFDAADGHGIACDHGTVRVAMRHARPHVVLLTNVLTADECDELIALSTPGLKPASVVDSAHGGSYQDERRTSELTGFPRGSSPLIARLDARIAQLTKVPVARGESLQVMRYGVGGEYEPHFDFFDIDKPGEAAVLQRGGQRIATLVIYLNDVEAGGETVFPRAGLSVAPTKGSAVYFAYTDAQSRCDPLSFHAGAPVVRGEKWIATRWMREREFGGPIALSG